jgi:glycopeptidolipid biosynthesis protein
MSTDPFDGEGRAFFGLVNDEEQTGLWPVFADGPAGWWVVYGEADRAACLNYIEHHRTDLEPRSPQEGLASGRALVPNRFGLERFG